MNRSLVILSAALALTACKAGSQDAAPAAETKPAAVQAAAKPVEAAAPAKEAAHGGCAAEAAQPVQAGEATTYKDASGATVTAAGSKLTNAQTVTVADLLARPDEFAGKTVRLEGNVSAMCVHARGWFAIADEGRTGRFIRVVTRPAFLVPEGSIGKFARAEGVVETVEVPADTAKHYAKEHQLGDPAAVQGPVKNVVIRAAGAEFI